VLFHVIGAIVTSRNLDTWCTHKTGHVGVLTSAWPLLRWFINLWRSHGNWLDQ